MAQQWRTITYEGPLTMCQIGTLPIQLGCLRYPVGTIGTLPLSVPMPSVIPELCTLVTVPTDGSDSANVTEP